jgi:hypothetical protein
LKNTIIIFTLAAFYFSCKTSKILGIYEIEKYNSYEISRALELYDTIYIPAGEYLVDQIVIRDNKVILTSGLGTKFKQRPQSEITSVILIKGSNVIIDPLTIEGNISKDKGEWNHAIAIMADGSNISNILIKGLSAKDIRGDGVYIGNTIKGGYPIRVTVENVIVENCFRNGISVVSGDQIRIKNINVNKVGLYAIDIESDPIDIPLQNIVIENVVGPTIGLIGYKREVKNVEILNVIIDRKLGGSIPSYPINLKDGLIFRNVNNIYCNTVVIKNFERFAINPVVESYDKMVDNVIIKNITLFNNSIIPNEYNAYINLMGFKTLNVEGLDARLQTGKSLFLGNDKPGREEQIVKINNSKIRGGTFARYCTVIGDSLNLDNMENVFQRVHVGSVVTNSSIKTNIFESNSGNLFLKLNNIEYRSGNADIKRDLTKQNSVKLIK